uniref:ATP synthase complex subunit 8 n=1 Tax=Chitala ornata TaxID=112145 RepID=C4IX44_CHIOR|nr:ATP synthase F0 subunit 8 [Chitala ornata]BAH58926.1 ATPase subunits 8 [Chitala ornata]
MPQLNPTPWLLMLLFSWLVFLTMIPTKIMQHHFTGDPAPQITKKYTPTPWTWPWH